MGTATATVSVVCERLLQVQARLDAAIESLVSLRLNKGSNERDALMREAAALLEDIHANWQREQQRGARQQADAIGAERQRGQVFWLLRSIQSQTGQLRGLNDAAIGLCRGWLSAPPSPLEDYTPEGVWPVVQEPRGIRIRG